MRNYILLWGIKIRAKESIGTVSIMRKLDFRLYILNLLRDSTYKVNVELTNFTYRTLGKGEQDKKNLPHTNTVPVHIKCECCIQCEWILSTLHNKLNFSENPSWYSVKRSIWSVKRCCDVLHILLSCLRDQKPKLASFNVFALLYE